MFWSDENIAKTREYLTDMNNIKAELLESLANLEKTLRADENFQKFRVGTPVGNRCSENIKTIIEVAKNSCDTTDEVVEITNRVLEQQGVANNETVGSTNIGKD